MRSAKVLKKKKPTKTQKPALQSDTTDGVMRKDRQSSYPEAPLPLGAGAQGTDQTPACPALIKVKNLDKE